MDSGGRDLHRRHQLIRVHASLCFLDGVVINQKHCALTVSYTHYHVLANPSLPVKLAAIRSESAQTPIHQIGTTAPFSHQLVQISNLPQLRLGKHLRVTVVLKVLHLSCGGERTSN